MLFWITTTGCKINQYESQAVEELLNTHEIRRAQSAENAELQIINTCCVTSRAMQKSRKAIRRAIANSGGGYVVIIGCYSTYDKNKLEEIVSSSSPAPKKYIVTGHRDNICEKIENLLSTILDRTEVSDTDSKDTTPAGTTTLPLISRFSGRQRPFLKIQDGCDSFCNYCIVPYTRPRLWSKEPSDVVEECRRLVISGHREIVLCGTRLGAYGRCSSNMAGHQAENALARLIEHVSKIEGLWRIRLSSLSPEDISEQLLESISTNGVAPHFHIPLQSGSDRILKAMNRPYSTDEYLSTLSRIRACMHNPAITTDLIVGYPGETHKDFDNTMETLSKAGFMKIHVFPFSSIEPTQAWRECKEEVPPRTVKERSSAVQELSQELGREYRRHFIGSVVEGVAEAPTTEGMMRATTERYLQVSFPVADEEIEDITGNIVKLRIEETADEKLQGILLRGKS